MSWRTSVYVYASDPISAAGARAQLTGQPAIEVVGPADVDRARVALVVTDAVDESAARVVRAIQRDGVPRVVLVAIRFDEAGVLASVAAGVTDFVRRSEATSARLAEVLRRADRSGCQLPEGLLKRAAASAGSGGSVASPGSATATDPDEASSASAADPTVSRPTVTAHLSLREAEIMRLVADGLDTGDIADRLAYSESTIKGVLAKVMGRLQARNRCQAVAIVVREGLI